MTTEKQRWDELPFFTTATVQFKLVEDPEKTPPIKNWEEFANEEGTVGVIIRNTVDNETGLMSGGVWKIPQGIGQKELSPDQKEALYESYEALTSHLEDIFGVYEENVPEITGE
jgi:hypothetical protein